MSVDEILKFASFVVARAEANRARAEAMALPPGASREDEALARRYEEAKARLVRVLRELREATREMSVAASLAFKLRQVKSPRLPRFDPPYDPEEEELCNLDTGPIEE